MAYESTSSLRWPDPGPMSVPDYQVSGVPWVTSSIVGTTATQVQFPRGTRWIEVTNLGANILRIGFSANGVNGNPPNQAHYYELSASSATKESATTRWELRCSSMFFAAANATTTFSLAASLTGVPARYLDDMSGSIGGVYDGIG